MAIETYRIVEHAGGWAYRAEGTFSEAFPTREAAMAAARDAARRQSVGGETVPIEWEDENGRWHVETAEGGDRPVTEIKP